VVHSVEAVQAAQGNALLELMAKAKEIDFKFNITAAKQAVSARLRSVSDPMLAKKVARFTQMLHEVTEVEVHMQYMAASDEQKAPVLALLQRLKNHLGLEMSIPIAKELVGDYKAGEQYVETAWPHVLSPVGKYVGLDFLHVDDKLLGKAKEKVDKAAPASSKSRGVQQPWQQQHQQGNGDRRPGRDGRRYDHYRGGHDGRGGGQYKRPRADEGRPNEGGQYLPGPPRY
jgi:hypothetical protein